MKRSITTLLGMALCGLSLCLVAAPSAHAQEKILLTARPSDAPTAIAVTDTPEGTGLNMSLATVYALLYAGTDWTIRADGELTVDKGGKTILSTRAWYGESMTYFFVHSRSGQQVIDGEIYRFQSDPTKGFANLWLTLPSKDGKSWSTINVYADLTFAIPQPGTTGGARAGVDF